MHLGDRLHDTWAFKTLPFGRGDWFYLVQHHFLCFRGELICILFSHGPLPENKSPSTTGSLQWESVTLPRIVFCKQFLYFGFVGYNRPRCSIVSHWGFLATQIVSLFSTTNLMAPIISQGGPFIQVMAQLRPEAMTILRTQQPRVADYT